MKSHLPIPSVFLCGNKEDTSGLKTKRKDEAVTWESEILKGLGKCELCVKKSKGKARNSGLELIVIPLSKSVSFPTMLASLI